jgi:uncharacterized repeat protein (TIGR03843 family)
MSVPAATAMSSSDAIEFLTRGTITIKGRMPAASNITLLAELALDGAIAFGIYKPGRGERPLWDFPPGLYKREVAAYRLSEALGWGLVPPTIFREGPHGIGSLQLFVDADFEQHYFTLLERPDLRAQLMRICLFDLVANNADRKGGHCLLGADDRIYAIDNGLTFHVEPKLRTVIWDFGGEPIPPDAIETIRRLADEGIPRPVAELLDPEERRALLARGRALARRGRFPKDASGLRYPWPLL